MDIKKLLDIAINKNILMYDGEADVGVLSIKLISLLIYQFEVLYNKRPEIILLPIEEKAFMYSEYIEGKRIELHNNNTFSILGVNIEFMKSYEEQNNLFKYYKDQGATLACSDIFLCLAYTYNNEVLLGSY